MPTRRRATKQAPPQNVGTFYALCGERLAPLADIPTLLSAIADGQLPLFVTDNTACALEVAARGFDAPTPSADPWREACAILLDPTPERMDHLWASWCRQAPPIPFNATIQAPYYFLFYRECAALGLAELARRMPHRRVLWAWLALNEPAETKEQLERLNWKLFTTLDAATRNMFRRTLKREVTDENRWWRIDPESVAITGAIEGEARLRIEQTRLALLGIWDRGDQGLAFLHRKSAPLPVAGMEDRSLWRGVAERYAFEVFAMLNAAVCGMTDRAMAEAADAAVQEEDRQADTEGRGGPGLDGRRKAYERAKAKGQTMTGECPGCGAEYKTWRFPVICERCRRPIQDPQLRARAQRDAIGPLEGDSDEAPGGEAGGIDPSLEMTDRAYRIMRGPAHTPEHSAELERAIQRAKDASPKIHRAMLRVLREDRTIEEACEDEGVSDRTWRNFSKNLRAERKEKRR